MSRWNRIQEKAWRRRRPQHLLRTPSRPLLMCRAHKRVRTQKCPRSLKKGAMRNKFRTHSYTTFKVNHCTTTYKFQHEIWIFQTKTTHFPHHQKTQMIQKVPNQKNNNVTQVNPRVPLLKTLHHPRFLTCTHIFFQNWKFRKSSKSNTNIFTQNLVQLPTPSNNSYKQFLKLEHDCYVN